MIKIKTNDSFINEKKYIFDHIIKERLDKNYEFIINDRVQEFYEIEYNQRCIHIRDHFFSRASPEYFKDQSLIPKKSIPITLHELKLINFPSFFGNNQIQVKENLAVYDFDIIGIIYFMLSRWEEFAKSESLDNFQRFDDFQSFAFKEGFNNRPIVDEAIESIRIFLNLDKRNEASEIYLTHDLDLPYQFLGRFSLFKSAIAELILRFNPTLFYKKFLESIFYNNKFYQDRYYENMIKLLDYSESINLKSKMYIMAGGDHPLDYPYPLKNTKINNLIKFVIKKGHEIGYHASFLTSETPSLFIREINEIESTFKLKVREGRQHFLKLSIPKFYYNWCKSELIDSSIYYPNIGGFRAGTCHDFYPFDFINKKTILVKERPLTLMDNTLLGLFQTSEQRYEYATLIIDTVFKFGGKINLLWHNHLLHLDEILYKKIISYLASK